jgi:two-component system invasion response regulator UvrY
MSFNEAATAKEALARYKEDRPDLVIMDLNLPGPGGLEAIGQLLREDELARILVFSVHGDTLHAARALEAGALGYVTKNAPPDQISQAIFRVAAGENYIESEIAQELALLNVRSLRQSSLPHFLKDLSLRDLEILRLLGEGHSVAQIADSVGLSYKTVANNCTNMKNKLRLSRTADLIRVALEYQISTRYGQD